MNINGLGLNPASIFGDKKTNETEQKQEVLEQAKDKKLQAEKLIQNYLSNDRLSKSMFELSPIERYNFIAQQKAISADPEQVVKSAQKTINESLLNGDDNAAVLSASQIKRMAQKAIDRSA